MQRTHLLANWRRYAGLLVVCLVLTPLFVLLPSWARGLAAGAWLSSIVWMLYGWSLIASGAASRVMGATGEQWTAQELRALTHRGWRLAHRVMIGRADIDHVAIGPGGLVTIESKWTSDACEPAAHPEKWRGAAHGLAERTDRLRKVLKASLGSVPVHRAVVVWGPQVRDADDPSATVAGVAVLPGSSLRSWLEQRPYADVPEDAIAAGWQRLEGDVRWRDDYDAARSTHPRPLSDLLRDVFVGVIAGFAGMLALAALVARLPDITLQALCTVAVVAIGLAARRHRAIRVMATGWTVGAAGAAAVAFASVMLA